MTAIAIELFCRVCEITGGLLMLLLAGGIAAETWDEHKSRKVKEKRRRSRHLNMMLQMEQKVCPPRFGQQGEGKVAYYKEPLPTGFNFNVEPPSPGCRDDGR